MFYSTPIDLQVRWQMGRELRAYIWQRERPADVWLRVLHDHTAKMESRKSGFDHLVKEENFFKMFSEKGSEAVLQVERQALLAVVPALALGGDGQRLAAQALLRGECVTLEIGSFSWKSRALTPRREQFLRPCQSTTLPSLQEPSSNRSNMTGKNATCF